ncbi:hypothetical protein [Streptomyces sp. NPDC010273]|uniref:hypothetical protein n=1 Tax=Streptomyces sp. NPDC010273 TaxID=3364829 RepID=UPI0036E1B896
MSGVSKDPVFPCNVLRWRLLNVAIEFRCGLEVQLICKVVHVADYASIDGRAGDSDVAQHVRYVPGVELYLPDIRPDEAAECVKVTGTGSGAALCTLLVHAVSLTPGAVACQKAGRAYAKG